MLRPVVAREPMLIAGRILGVAIVGGLMLPAAVWVLVMRAAIDGAVPLPSWWLPAWPALVGTTTWLLCRPAALRFARMVVSEFDLRHTPAVVCASVLGAGLLFGVAGAGTNLLSRALPSGAPVPFQAAAGLALGLLLVVVALRAPSPVRVTWAAWWRTVAMIAIVEGLAGLHVRLAWAPLDLVAGGTRAEQAAWVGGSAFTALGLQTASFSLLVATTPIVVVAGFAVGTYVPSHVLARVLPRSAPRSR